MDSDGPDQTAHLHSLLTDHWLNLYLRMRIFETVVVTRIFHF